MRKFVFTTKWLDALKTNGKQLDYWDANVNQLGLRVSAKGKKVWTFFYRFQGRQRRLSLGRYPDLSLADARQKAIAANGDLAKGIDPAGPRDALRASRTFGTLSEDYIARHAKPFKRSWATDQAILDRDILPLLKNRKLTDISRLDAQEIIDRVLRRGSTI